MGTCQNICKNQVNEKEFTTYQKSKGKNKEQDRDQKTDLKFSQQFDLMKDDSIGDELQTIPQKEQPLFIAKKEIQSIVLSTDRKNRFMHDMEEEVKYRIRQIQSEEQENLKRLQQQYEIEIEKQRAEQKKKEQQNDFDNQFSFQNSMKPSSQADLHQTSNPYLPRQASQFAPKRNDNDTVSQKSQISKTPTPPIKDQSVSPKSDMMRKSALKKIQLARDEIASMNVDCGSQNSLASKKIQQLEAYEKMFSEFFSQDEKRSSGSRTQKSVKSILKHNTMSQRSISMGKNSIKSTHTVFRKQSKKVRFSNDTNFNNERRGVKRVRRSWWDW